MSTASRRPSRRAVAAVLAACLSLVGIALVTDTARADNLTISYDLLRTGWDPNEPNLGPSDVSSPDFGQLFATQLDGQIYAQPVVARSTVIAVTENNKVYGLDPVSGAIRWSRNVGPALAGVGHRVRRPRPQHRHHRDAGVRPGDGTAYFTAKVNDGPDLDHPHCYLHAVDITTGVERSGCPATIQGTPTNDPTNVFNAKTAMQRPGLLLLDGVVYAGLRQPLRLRPVRRLRRRGRTRPRASRRRCGRPRPAPPPAGAGIWQSRRRPGLRRPGRIFLATGNGVSPPPGPGTSPPGTSGRVGGPAAGQRRRHAWPPRTSSARSTTPTWTPTTPTSARAARWPCPTASAPPRTRTCIVQAGKDGRVFLLDRDNLGGDRAGARRHRRGRSRRSGRTTASGATRRSGAATAATSTWSRTQGPLRAFTYRATPAAACRP